MKAWFEDLPLDFAREETRAAERLLTAGYPMNQAALMLAQDVGLDISLVNQGQALSFLMRDLLENARQADRLTTLLAEVLRDPAKEGIRADLRRLIAGHEATIAAAGMRQRPSITTLAGLPPTIEAWGAGRESPQPLATPGLEKTINEEAGFTDPAALRERLAEAEVRTARVDIGGKPKGTGFLVANDLLITNWHVVSGNVAGAVATFDNKVEGGRQADPGRDVAFADDWLVAHSPHEPKSVELGADGPPDGTWDFAIVRLTEPVGAQAIGPDPDSGRGDPRGNYTLNGGAYDFAEAEPLFILGHPEGRPVQLSWASPAQVRRTKHLNRIRYQTNTEGGSSGSPVFNRDWRVVALHHAAGPTSKPGDFNLQSGEFNQGIPMSGIVSELKTQLSGRPELAELALE